MAGIGTVAGRKRMITHRVTLPELRHLASKFVRTLKTGDVIFMEGDLGAGKTEFVRAAIQSLMGSNDPVPSPTFTLVQTYDTTPAIWHYDLYRITDPEEVLELGMDEAFQYGITFIEWPQRLQGIYPLTPYRIQIQGTENADERIVNIVQP